MSDAEVADVSRRTRLAAERTWLAWWRSGIAAAFRAGGVAGVGALMLLGLGVPLVIAAIIAFLVSGAKATPGRYIGHGGGGGGGWGGGGFGGGMGGGGGGWSGGGGGFGGGGASGGW